MAWYTIKKESAKKVAEALYQTTVALIDLIQETESESNVKMYSGWANQLSDHLDTLIKAESPNMY